MIKTLSLEQKLLWPILILVVLGHSAVFLLVGHDFFSDTSETAVIEVNLYQSFKKEKQQPGQSQFTVREGAGGFRSLQAEGGGGVGNANYLSGVYAQIERHKYYPEAEKEQGHEGKVKVAFVVRQDGKLEKLWLVKECPYQTLNQAALQTIKAAVPFAPIPAALARDKLSIIIEIAYQLL